MEREKRFLCPICSNNINNQICNRHPLEKKFQEECNGFRPLKDEEAVKIGGKVPLSNINRFLGYN